MYSTRLANKSCSRPASGHLCPLLAALVSCLLLLLAAPRISWALRNSVRSVQVCAPISRDSGFHFRTDESFCERHCHKSHSGSKRKKANAASARSYLKTRASDAGPATCCCLFEEPWAEFMEPKLVGAEYFAQKSYSPTPGDCMPLAFGINLSHKTRESYKSVCRILKQKEPPTMLELLEYAEAAAHLNYMAPKHPAILKTLKLKQVSRVDHKMAQAMRNIIHQDFLDSVKPLNHFEGYELDPSKLATLSYQVNFHVKSALQSVVVAIAFDEYIISYSIMDIMAANARIHQVNTKQLRVPPQLLQNHYDSYDKSSWQKYFRLEHLDCPLLRKTNAKLLAYLNGLKKTLDSLSEKLVYDHMLRNYDSLQNLENTKKIYRELIHANCV